MSKSKEKVLARELYLHTENSQKDIAEKVGVTEQTIGKWISQGKWDMLKGASTISRESLLRNAYEQLATLNEKIQNEFNGVPDKKHNDARVSIIRQINTLDRRESLSLVVSIMESFIKHIKSDDIELAKQVSPYTISFLESRNNEA